MKAPTMVIGALSAMALIGSGCGRPSHHERMRRNTEATLESSQNIAASSVFGDARVTAVPNLCAGRVKLAQGVATVNDSCFTGDTNVVLCTDSTAANAVQCAAANRKLELAGTGSDLINYARIR
jgi:hypothetical protein